jgi:hypothetical protein
MNDYNPSTIWYASQRWALSSLKWKAYEDRGALAIRKGVARFAGLRGEMIQIENATNVDLASQSSNWPFHVVAASALFVLLTARGIPFVITVPLIALTAVAGFVLGQSSKWVRISYRAENGQMTTAWFADGTAFGWGSMLGESDRLREVIRDHLLVGPDRVPDSQFTEEWIVLGIPRDTENQNADDRPS